MRERPSDRRRRFLPSSTYRIGSIEAGEVAELNNVRL
jgi:hypothetical protein